MKLSEVLISIAVAIVISVIVTRCSVNKRIEHDCAYNSESFDSLLRICNEKPDTFVRIDTFWMDKVVNIPQYVPALIAEGETNTYSDTIDNAELHFVINDFVKGYIVERNVGYHLKVPLLIHDTVRIYQPVPQIVEKYTKNEFKSVVTGSIGFDYYSIGYGKIIGGRHIVSAQMMYYSGKPNVGLSYSYMFEK